MIQTRKNPTNVRLFERPNKPRTPHISDDQSPIFRFKDDDFITSNLKDEMMLSRHRLSASTMLQKLDQRKKSKIKAKVQMKSSRNEASVKQELTKDKFDNDIISIFEAHKLSSPVRLDQGEKMELTSNSINAIKSLQKENFVLYNKIVNLKVELNEERTKNSNLANELRNEVSLRADILSNCHHKVRAEKAYKETLIQLLHELISCSEEVSKEIFRKLNKNELIDNLLRSPQYSKLGIINEEEEFEPKFIHKEIQTDNPFLIDSPTEDRTGTYYFYKDWEGMKYHKGIEQSRILHAKRMYAKHHKITEEVKDYLIEKSDLAIWSKLNPSSIFYGTELDKSETEDLFSFVGDSKFERRSYNC